MEAAYDMSNRVFRYLSVERLSPFVDFLRDVTHFPHCFIQFSLERLAALFYFCPDIFV